MLEGTSSGANYCSNLCSLFSICIVYTILEAQADYYVLHGFGFVPKFQVSKFNSDLSSVTFIQNL